MNGLAPRPAPCGAPALAAGTGEAALDAALAAVTAGQYRRPDDAWVLLAEPDELLERLYGPRTFRPFTMPEAHRRHATHRHERHPHT